MGSDVLAGIRGTGGHRDRIDVEVLDGQRGGPLVVDRHQPAVSCRAEPYALSRLRAEIEITLRRPRESEDYVNTLRSCLEEVERLTTLVEELLMLARIDSGQNRGAAEPAPLATLVQNTIERLQPQARDHGVEIRLTNDLRENVNT